VAKGLYPLDWAMLILRLLAIITFLRLCNANRAYVLCELDCFCPQLDRQNPALTNHSAP